jgi:hypothetical protein
MKGDSQLQSPPVIMPRKPIFCFLSIFLPSSRTQQQQRQKLGTNNDQSSKAATFFP